MAESQVWGNTLATVGAVVDVPTILTSIASSVQKISEQRRSGRKKCEELQADVLTLSLMIQRFQTSQSGLRVEELVQLISRIENCLARFAKKNWLDDAVEAIFKREYSQLRGEYRRLEERFMLVSIDDIRNNLNQAVPLWIKVLETTKEAASIHSPVNLALETSSLTWEGSIGRGQVAGYGDVECRRLDDSTASRHALQLYQDLQRGAHVQTIHGITEINKEKYVIMQDCSGLKMLQSWRNDGSRELTLSDRAHIAYDVAQSVAWFHEGGLVVKFLTDTSIRLTDGQNCRQQPVLTSLQYARCLYEKTNSARTDVRYEAPEILKELLGSQGQRLRPHSQETDIWSLGIVIWQILTDRVPYRLEKEIKFLNPETVSTLRRCLESSSVPGDFPSDLPSPLVEIIQSCWSPIDHGRPPAKAVTSSLLRALALLDSVVAHSRPDRMDDAVVLMNFQELDQARSAARELVQKGRDGNLCHQADQLSEDHFNVLLHHAEDPLHPECAFLVGATIWWKVVNIWLIRDSVTPRALGFDGRRAELALSYLLVASDRGYTDANLETARAYAALYHDYNDRVGVVTHL